MKDRPYIIGWDVDRPGVILIHTKRATLFAVAVMLITTGTMLFAVGLSGGM